MVTRRNGTLFSDKQLAISCAILYLLNVLDYVLTLRIIFALGFGFEAEGNHVMAFLFEHSPVGAAMFKLVVTGMNIAFLYSQRKYKLARYGIVGLLGIYALLSIYHFFIIAMTFGM